MPDISRNVNVTVNLSAFDMGQEFARMYSEEQAMFFQGIAAETRNWVVPSVFQWDMMRRDLDKLPDGLRVFKDMGEYANDF